MSSHSQQIRQRVWSSLHGTFGRHSKGESSLAAEALPAIVRELLGEESESEAGFVVRNLHKIDSNGNGRIEFGEFVRRGLLRPATCSSGTAASRPSRGCTRTASGSSRAAA